MGSQYLLMNNQGRSTTKIVGEAKVWKKWPPWLAHGENFDFEWPKAAQMPLKFLFFSGIFLNIFRLSLLHQNNFCEPIPFCKYFFRKI